MGPISGRSCSHANPQTWISGPGFHLLADTPSEGYGRPGPAMPAPQGARASPPAVTTGASPPSMRRSSWDGSPPHRRVQPSRLRQPKAHAPLRRVARRSDPTGDSAMRGELGGAVTDSRHGPTPQLQGRHSSASLDRSKLSLLKKRMSSRRVSTRAVAQGT